MCKVSTSGNLEELEKQKFSQGIKNTIKKRDKPRFKKRRADREKIELNVNW